MIIILIYLKLNLDFDDDFPTGGCSKLYVLFWLMMKMTIFLKY